MASETYDLIVVGAGPGGYVAAIRAAQLGMKVVCVEKESALGGTCLRVGCIPSKALLDSSERFIRARKEFSVHGIQCKGVSLDLDTMLGRKDKVVESLTKGIDGLFRKNKIRRVTGHARLAGKGKVTVQANGNTDLEAKYVLIATGSKPALLQGVEVNGEGIGTSTEALCYNPVPDHLVVIGAGYIGLELGSVWSRLGSKVTVLEYLDRILPGMDSEMAREAHRMLEKQGLEFRLGSKVTGARQKGKKVKIEVEDSDPLECDKLLVAVGRIPNTKNLGLEESKVEVDRQGRITVDRKFQTSVEGIFAIGDVIAGPMLAHKAEEEGIAVSEMLAGGYGHVDYNAIPGVVYTHPEIASVGKTEDELKEANMEYGKGVFHFRANGRALAMGDSEGRVKMLADAKTDRLLGVHIMGTHAGELINEAAAAMSFGASSEDLARVCHAHPTLAEAIRESALAVDQRAIHS